MKAPLLVALLASPTLALFSVYEDLFASPKFLVRYDTNDEITHSEAHELAHTPDNSTYEYLRANDGSQYICQIPPVQEEDDQTPILEEGLSSKLNRYSVEITKQLKDTSLFHVGGGYWTYVLNSQKEVAQFYGGPNKYEDPNTYKYILGRGDERIDFPKLEARKGNGIFYLSHAMNNGSICDVTGKPRSVEVQYVCDPSQDKPRLQWVKEYRTCQYQAQVSLPFLCEDELLKQREDNFNEILCTKVVDAKTRDTSRDNKKVFNHRERINIMDYNLISLGEQLFIGQLKDNASIIIETSKDSSDFYGRLIRAFIKNFPKHFITSPPLKQRLTTTMDFRYHANIYDKTGQFIRSTYIEAKFNEKHQLVLHTAESTRDFKVENFNVEQLPSSLYKEDTQSAESNALTPEEIPDDSVKVDIIEGVQMDTLLGAIVSGDDDIIVMKFKKGENGELGLIGIDTEPAPNAQEEPIQPAHDEL